MWQDLQKYFKNRVTWVSQNNVLKTIDFFKKINEIKIILFQWENVKHTHKTATEINWTECGPESNNHHSACLGGLRNPQVGFLGHKLPICLCAQGIVLHDI